MSNNETPTKKEKVEPPKRPLSSYNLFFLFERKRIIDGTDDAAQPITAEEVRTIAKEHETKPRRRHRKSHGKISFKDLARTLADRWKALDPPKKKIFEEQARSLWAEYEAKLQEFNTNNPSEAISASEGQDPDNLPEEAQSNQGVPEQQRSQLLSAQQGHSFPNSQQQQQQQGLSNSQQQELANQHRALAGAQHAHALASSLANQQAYAKSLQSNIQNGTFPHGASQLLSQNGLNVAGLNAHAASLNNIQMSDHSGLSQSDLSRLSQSNYYAELAAAAAGAQASHLYQESLASQLVARSASTSSNGVNADKLISDAEKARMIVQLSDAEKTRMMVQQSIDQYLAASSQGSEPGKRKYAGEDVMANIKKMKEEQLQGPDSKPSAQQNPHHSYRCDLQDVAEVSKSRIQFCVRGKPRPWRQDMNEMDYKATFMTAVETLLLYHFGLVPKYPKEQLLTATFVFCFPRDEGITTTGSVDGLIKFVVEALEGKLYDLTGQVVSVHARKKYDVAGGSGYTNLCFDADPDFMQGGPRS